MVAAVVLLALSVSPQASLRIAVWPDGRPGAARVSRIVCPSRAAACARLAAIADPFAPTPPGTACTEIYGGPQEALVTGTFRGRRIWTRLTRRDGCAIARWDRVAFLFAK